MAGNSPNFNISIGAVTTELKKGLQEARRELQNFQKEVNSRKLSPDYKASMQSERIEGQKLTNQIKAVRLESAQLTLEQRKNKTATDAAAGSYREAQQRLTALGKSIREANNGFTQNSESVNKQIKEYNQLNSQLKAFDARMGNFQRNVGNYPGGASILGAAIPSVGQLGGLVGAVGVAAQAYRSAGKSVVAFDSGLRNVEKTTGLTRQETQALGDEFINLSRNLQVVSARALAEYSSTAGQLGVKGTENILIFAESLAKLETASDIAGEDGAAKIARLLTLTDGGVQNVKRFGDEIVNLGNNFAATESEILENATRIAQSTGVYKFGRENVLAYATATKSVGVEAELVGSTIGRTLGIIEGLSRSTKSAEQITKLLGISQAELQRRFKENSGQVLTDFIGALRKVDEAGGSVNGTLEQLGISAIRDKTVLGSLATNGFAVLTDAINKTRESTGALDKEFGTQSTKLEAQINKVNIAWENFILNIDKGDGALSKFAGGFSSFIAGAIDGMSELVNSGGFRGFMSMFNLIANPIAFNSDLAATSITKSIGKAFGLGANQPYNPNQPRIETGYSFLNQRSFEEEFMGQGQRGYRRTKAYDDYYSRIVKGINSVENASKDSVMTLQNQSAALIKNKDFWDDQVKSITASIEAMDLSEIGSKKFLELQKELSVAQKNLDVYSKKSLTGSSTIKGKTQAEIIKEANEALAGGQANALRGLEGELAKIDLKWAGILDKINKIADVGLRNQLAGVAAINKEAEKYNKFLEAFAKSESSLTRNVPSRPSGTLNLPTSLPGLQQTQARLSKGTSFNLEDDELSRYMQRTLRSGVSNALTSIFDDISNLTQGNFEIEQKYAKLREESTADQIEGLKKMEKLEKSINNGFSKLLQNTVSSFNQLGTRTLSSAVGEGISTGNFDQLSGLFSGKKAGIGYGSLVSTLGGVIGGASKSNAGKMFGNVLSLAGSGAAIGTSIAPGLGTAIGAVAGAIVGAISGILSSSEQQKQRELQNLQLAEERKQTALQQRIAALSYNSSIIGQQTNQGVVTGIDRDFAGNLVATISGSELQIILDRSKTNRG
jgi:TP901 family phage tail tape measure protein